MTAGSDKNEIDDDTCDCEDTVKVTDRDEVRNR